MRAIILTCLLLLLCLAAHEAKSSSRSSPSGRRKPSTSSRVEPSGRVNKRKQGYEDLDADDEFLLPEDSFSDEDSSVSDAEVYRPRARTPSSSRREPSSSTRPGPPRSPRSKRYEEMSDDDDDYVPPRRSSRTKRPPSRRSPPSRRPQGSGRMVAYSRKQTPSTLSRGFEALKNSMPDPTAVRDAAVNSLNVAKEATSGLSANLYREVKGLTSSELEQVMLKATRPDDNAVKGKHVERLVGVSYQISPRYDLYDAVLRKLWSKMAEKDWRTTIKALYILHRFSADGAPGHASALKARVRELRRTRDPKRKEKYFNSKLLLAGDNKPESAPYRAFMSRYAHYVLLRAQCFGGMFQEISVPDSSSKEKGKATQKPITATALRSEHLEAAKLLLKAGIACQLKKGEDCENTAVAVERVASDLIALSGSVAKVLNVCLNQLETEQVDSGLVKKWCEFYSEDLSKQTRLMVKRTAPILDAYGLFLPSRMGPTVSQDLLQKGLQLEDQPTPSDGAEPDASVENESPEDEEEVDDERAASNLKEDEDDDEVEIEDDYEYDEDDAYYDEDEDDI